MKQVFFFFFSASRCRSFKGMNAQLSCALLPIGLTAGRSANHPGLQLWSHLVHTEAKNIGVIRVYLFIHSLIYLFIYTFISLQLVWKPHKTVNKLLIKLICQIWGVGEKAKHFCFIMHKPEQSSLRLLIQTPNSVSSTHLCWHDWVSLLSLSIQK